MIFETLTSERLSTLRRLVTLLDLFFIKDAALYDLINKKVDIHGRIDIRLAMFSCSLRVCRVGWYGILQNTKSETIRFSRKWNRIENTRWASSRR